MRVLTVIVVLLLFTVWLVTTSPHLGHKGLFLDRLDVGIVMGYGGAESPRLVPYARSLYHNRNRVYAPALGRFMQRDPNATAQALLASSSTGRGFAAVSLAFSMEDLYGDGMKLYEYVIERC